MVGVDDRKGHVPRSELRHNLGFVHECERSHPTAELNDQQLGRQVDGDGEAEHLERLDRVGADVVRHVPERREGIRDLAGPR